MRLNRDGSGEFTDVVLHPRVQLADEDQRALADSLHDEAHHLCFIARSVNFPVRAEPSAP
jgi:organic hydroperoxide reductase OsmC/OhrA